MTRNMQIPQKEREVPEERNKKQKLLKKIFRSLRQKYKKEGVYSNVYFSGIFPRVLQAKIWKYCVRDTKVCETAAFSLHFIFLNFVSRISYATTYYLTKLLLQILQLMLSFFYNMCIIHIAVLLRKLYPSLLGGKSKCNPSPKMPIFYLDNIEKLQDTEDHALLCRKVS